MKPKTPTRSQLQAALEDLATSNVKRPDIIPDGWKTCEDWSREIGLSVSVTGAKLSALVRSGQWESKKFRIEAGLRIYPVHHYRKVVAK